MRHVETIQEWEEGRGTKKNDRGGEVNYNML
jgi:hypothetical protein